MTSNPDYPHLPSADWIAEQLRKYGLDDVPKAAAPRVSAPKAVKPDELNARWQSALDAGDLAAIKEVARDYHKTFHALPAELQQSGNGALMHNIGHYAFPTDLTPEALDAIRALPVPAPLPKSIKRGPGYAAP